MLNLIPVRPALCNILLIVSPILVNKFSSKAKSPVAIASENKVNVSSPTIASGSCLYNSKRSLNLLSFTLLASILSSSNLSALPKLIAVCGLSTIVLNNTPCKSS